MASPIESAGVAADDAQLVSDFVRGDRRAIEAVDVWLVRAAGPFRRRLGVDWEDVLQEVRIEVLRLLRHGSFRGESSLKTYLWQVTAHTCLDTLRRRARRPLFDALEPEEPLPSADPSPLDRVLARERGQALLAVLETMSRECRDLWDLILAGLSYRNISARLGVSEGALRLRALRCRRHAAEVAGRDTVAARTSNE
jgi:RNA polymerase sigma factor (sigma-70 family)